jgi:uncharacterized membrane protein YraQ (UPF0718 family)
MGWPRCPVRFWRCVPAPCCRCLAAFTGAARAWDPAIAFLYSGPAINVLAIILTAKILGVELGVARAVGAVSFALVIGLIMHWIYRREEQTRAANQKGFALGADEADRLGDTAGFFALMIAVLVLANWAPASAEDSAIWHTIFAWKWPLTALAGVGSGRIADLALAWRWQPLAPRPSPSLFWPGWFPNILNWRSAPV